MFLTFEGIDGSGKTTQLKRLAAYLRRQGLPVVETREPGGTPLGERIRALLLRGAGRGMDARTELLLMFAARAEHVAQVIRPALAAGKVVLCDRFTDASLAYQGYGRGLERRFIRELDRLACRGVKPNLTFVVDINPRTSLQRAKRRNRRARVGTARFERETRAFYERVRRGYQALARAEPRRVRQVNGEDTIKNIHRKIVALVARRLGLRPRGRER
ncbi:MAG: dTMP kinase [Terriglobia bacterium]